MSHFGKYREHVEAYDAEEEQQRLFFLAKKKCY
jgi:hypothetical protein